MPSFLIIQTAFIGDVVLATALIEKLHEKYPEAPIDFLLRKGNEGLLTHHPLLRRVLVWEKKKGKIRNLLSIIGQVRRARYDHVINVHRFASSGIITMFSGGGSTVGFSKNPFSWFFTRSVSHILATGTHEILRNQGLIRYLTDEKPSMPRLYPAASDRERIATFQQGVHRYVCVAPTSVWFTKQYPKEKWIEFIDRVPTDIKIFLLGGPADHAVAEEILKSTCHTDVVNLSGHLSFLESAALMHGAVMNYTNDSAPMHFASAMNAPITAVFCSTVQSFGFGPLSEKRFVAEVRDDLECRPCGLHGFRQCPHGHFRCAQAIQVEDLLIRI